MFASDYSSNLTPATRAFRIGPTTISPSSPAFRILDQHIRRVSAGGTIIHESDTTGSVLVVVDGWLSATKSLASGEEQLIDFVLPGDFISPIAADGLTASLSVVAITEATVSILPQSVWRSMLEDDPKLSDVVDRVQAAERARFSERILRLGRGTAQTRIAYALLEFCVRICSPRKTGKGGFHVPLTQAHFGAFTGLSSVHVCRTMRKFVEDGIIETADHMDICILDRDALAAYAGIEADKLAQEIRPVVA